MERKPENSIEKQDIWNQTMEQINRIADSLGKPIDEGIKETVASFMVNKFPTRGSCEGHVGKRFDKMIKLRPYVAIGLSAPWQRFAGDIEIKNRIADQFGIPVDEIEENDAADKAYWDYINQNDIPETSEYLAIREKNRESEKLILEILQLFYEGRQVKEDAKLIIERIGPAGYFKVTTAKKAPKEIDGLDLEKYKEELSQEQEEMKSFTQFLKERFFNSSN